MAAKDLEQSAELKALYSGEAYGRKQIAYADQHHAGVMQVVSLESKSIAGKTHFDIKLAPDQRSQNNSFVMESSYNGHTANEIAQLRVRWMLLNEALPKDLGRFFPAQITDAYGHRVTIENSIFPELWVKLQSQSRSFLPKAWLWAVYHLKQSQLVEDVLALELGPIKDKVMPVRFRGRRRQSYVNQEPFTIDVMGNCPLSV
ncbi:MAG: hypothetical protein HC895_02980 [Leptolyngbyaceae cyanobacterium SM1_3_5]|nr:hypothetical protein [Leptolyngbyaceae cyanobacterium SM1_3_5]